MVKNHIYSQCQIVGNICDIWVIKTVKNDTILG